MKTFPYQKHDTPLPSPSFVETCLVPLRTATVRPNHPKYLVELEKERRLLAYDLHDGFAQELAALLTLLPLEAELTLKKSLLALVEQMARELDRLLQELLSPLSETLDLSRALHHVICEFQSRHDVAIHLSIADDLIVSGAMGKSVQRIVQEALTNAIRHGGARRVCISVQHTADTLEGSVQDDGFGFDRSMERSIGHLGLEGMQERCTLLGGHLHISSRKGGGTSVSFRIPVFRTPGIAGQSDSPGQ